MERFYWNDETSFLIEEDLEPFFHDAVSRGYRPFRDGDFSLAFGISDGMSREVHFSRRSAREPLLEVTLFECSNFIRLGSYFGLDDTTCVVINGYESAQMICDSWLIGDDIETVLIVTSFFNRRGMGLLRLNEQP